MKSSLLLRTAVRTVLDCLFCWIAWAGAIAVFSYFSMQGNANFAAANSQIWVMIVSCVLFYSICGVHKSPWWHPGLGSAVRLAVAVMLGSLTVYIFIRLRLGGWANPGIGMMAFYFLFTMSLGIRIYRKVAIAVATHIRRFFKTPESMPTEPVRTLLVGAGESASAFLMNKNQQGPRPREILGIVDNEPRKHGYALHGVDILGDDGKIPQLVKSLRIDEIIIAVPSMPNDDLRRIVKLTPIKSCKVRILSGLSSDKASDMLRDINIGDLLGRSENVPNAELIGKWVRGKTVLITGGGGSIGSEICRQLTRFKPEKIVIYDISENNAFNLNEELTTKNDTLVGDESRIFVRIGSVQDEQRLDEVFGEFRPDIVFHAAAYKHVPLMEECPRLAFENNTLGTFQTARCACRYNAERFVLISTDKAVNPTSVMGATKRLAELLVLGFNAHKCPPDLCNHGGERNKMTTQFACVRFGNVLESNGSVIPTFKRQITAGGPITVTHPEMIRYFMTMSEAAQLVLESGAMTGGGEIFILNMGEPVKIVDLAENLIRMAGLTPGVDINIETVGLRPGEKLYEELLLNEEGLTETVNEKIFVIKPASISDFHDFLGLLLAHATEGALGGDDVRDMLKHFILEYQGK